MGRRKASAIRFSSSFNKISASLRLTDEMLGLINSGRKIPLDNLHDAAEWIEQIRLEGSYILPERAYRLARTVAQMAIVRNFFSEVDDSGNNLFPLLAQNFADIPVFPEIEKKIDSVINKFMEVKDTASPTLASIRREIAAASASLSGKMRRLMDKAVSEGLISADASASVRDGRVVMPVPAMNKRRIEGIVHDSSATGKTVFIEPAPLVEVNNRIRELQLEEKKEIIVILTGLADFIRPYIDEISEGLFRLGELDFVHAKALLAIETGGQMPNLSKRPQLEWYHAVHPMLFIALNKQGKEVVPLDITLTPEKRILLVSGPNAGGKSVALKTVGIVQYMMQCGLLPPVYSNSHMGIFSDIFIDIGDEQSIENDLSTYSSHLRNMKYFVSNASKTSLFLADEIGSGTEPQIGGALAQSILAELRDKGAYGVVTTHYHNLKTFADAEKGFVNGAMLYDRQQLRPLFKLSIGNPGSSFALEIARKAGLPLGIIEKAKEIVGSDYVNIDKYLLDLSRDRKYWADKRLSIKEKEKEIQNTLERLNQRADILKASRAEILSSAKKEAEEIVSGVNARIERTIREIRESQAEKEKTKQLRKELAEYAESVSNKVESDLPQALRVPKIKNKSRKKAEVSEKPVQRKELAVGDYVKMSGGGVPGKILSIKSDRAEVAFGALRSFVQLKSLIPASKPKESATSVKMSVSSETIESARSRQLAFKQELDVRGMRVDEALQAVTYFLDDANQFTASRVRILHGTGTGALKIAIRQYLASVPFVSSFADEDVRFGGAGITVVNLD